MTGSIRRFLLTLINDKHTWASDLHVALTSSGCFYQYPENISIQEQSQSAIEPSDTDMMDWLEEHFVGQRIHIWPNNHQDGVTKIFPAGSHDLLARGHGLREAVKAAMTAMQKEPLSAKEALK